MTSTYVNDLRLNEMATGDASGSWGTVTNTNLELIGEALGYGTEAITTNADTHTSTIADGATDPIRAIFIKYTGTLDSACTITIGPNTVNKFCFIHNATSGSQSIIISQGSGANVTIATGQTKGVYLDGAGSGAAVIDAFATLSVVDLLVDDDLTVAGDVAVTGATTTTGTLTVGVDGTGHDVKFFGDTASAYMLWDASADDLILGGAAGLSVNSAALVTGVLTTTAATVFNGGFASNANSTINTSSSGVQPLLTLSQADNTSGNTWGFDFKRTTGTGAGDLVAKIHAAREGGDATGIAFSINKADGSLIEAVKINSAGNVGIGTSSPSALMHISGGSTDTDGIHYIATNTSSGPAGIVMNSGHGNWKIINSQTVANALEFIDGGSPDATRMIIDSSGNVNIADGNLIVAAGHGIDFSAQTATSAGGASATSELFDHYEEGTWTPALSNFTVTGATTVNGRYTRIGRQVTLQGSVSAATSIAFGTSCLISGFPFAGVTYVSEAISRVAGTITSGGFTDLPSSNHSAACFTDPPNSRVFLGNFTTLGANEVMYFTMIYFVA